MKSSGPLRGRCTFCGEPLRITSGATMHAHCRREAATAIDAPMRASVRLPSLQRPAPPARELVVLVDTREQQPPPFPTGVRCERATLGEGDYTTALLKGSAVVERKSPGDFVQTITWDRARWDREIERLDDYDHKAVVVEASFDDCCMVTRARWEALLGSVCSLFAHHDCPVMFAGSPRAAGRFIAGTLRRWEERIERALPPVPLAFLLRDSAIRLLGAA